MKACKHKQQIFSLVGALILAFLAACAPSNGPHKPLEGDGAEQKATSSNLILGYDRVRPIFANYCAACHPSRSSPNWLEYNQARTYALNGQLVARAVQTRTMPPPGSPQAAAITDTDRGLLEQWAQGGAALATSERSTPLERGAPLVGGESGRTLGAIPPGNEVVQGCLNCHGMDGPSTNAQPKIPRISGQNNEYLVEQLRRFKWRDRIDPTNTMNDIAADLSDEQMRVAATFFSSRPVGPPREPDDLPLGDRMAFERGRKVARENCVSCHMNRDYLGRPTVGLIPVLAGQSKIYLISQLLYYRSGQRQNPLMQEFARYLSNEDIEAVSIYFSAMNVSAGTATAAKADR